MQCDRLVVRRALLSVTDKTGIEALARAMAAGGTELVATGRTGTVLRDAGLSIVPIEKISGSPEAFRGRMKTLSFPVCSGILYRRGDAGDEADRERLGIPAVDCVVVNFYPFEKAARESGITHEKLIEEVDIGGPALVRAAAKNAPAVLVLTHPAQYERVIGELRAHGSVSVETALWCAAAAWDIVSAYDAAIARELGTRPDQIRLRYGENPHQKASLEVLPDSPLAWPVRDEDKLTAAGISYNNALDVSAAYALAGDLEAEGMNAAVIVKHNNPCGAGAVFSNQPGGQKRALELAWAGDPVSAFGGVVVFTRPLERATAEWLSSRFIELVAAPGLVRGSGELSLLAARRKNLKALCIRRFGEVPRALVTSVPGGVLRQSPDSGAGTAFGEELKMVTKAHIPSEMAKLCGFGIAVCRALKSNAVAIVREASGGFQLVGAGQGQPNRVDSVSRLAVPRARAVCGTLEGCLLVSDAFFPFRDAVDAAQEAGIRYIVQPGGSLKDADSIDACDTHGIAMAFTGVRHFRH
ncbi:MAG: hypothetical protein A2583_13040 [Bdellovibrionales bacterium RIFOXYD1_FULL_53_11]|nr:MAG: hypothetical protein A2583_13040 [Bdellovibrionales bacterium RIFOXYD1_FULL_53_11]